MRYGIFGGTLDPPHIAHLILAAEAFHQLALERVLWVLTPQPPHKQGQTITSVSSRLEMLKAALGDDPFFALSMVDIQRSPPHYAVDTQRILLKEYPGAELFYIMGGDSLMDLPTWKKPNEFIQVCDGLGVLERPGREVDLDGLEAQMAGVRDKVHFIHAPLLEISSSEIRRRVSLGMPYRYYLPPSVYKIVQAQQLYMTN